MATLHSAGLYDPAGLRYLISEGHLPHDATHTDYKWSQQPYIDEHGCCAVEEVLRVGLCVVWSRNRIIKRVFNLDIEAELILHAFATVFSGAKLDQTDELGSTLPNEQTAREPALVVILKTQAHIFCLSGAVHVIPLAFVVARAVPFLHGCLLQPEIHPRGQLHHGNIGASTSKWQDLANPTSSTSVLFGEASASRSIPSYRNLPSYCIIDLLSEMSLIAASPTRRLRDSEECPLLPSDEELLYASVEGSLSSDISRDVCLVVTLNRDTFTCTIWQAERRDRHLHTTKAESDSNKYRKRQSSNIHERPRVTSAGTATDLPRDSFGGLVQSFVDNDPRPQSSQLSNIENLAAELGKDFEPTGMQTRSARRISSMLARTDLAPGTDRSTFNETNATVRKNLSRTVRKEGSFGSHTERNSFGGRRSFPATTSIYSNATSFLESGIRVSVGEGRIGGTDDADFEVVHDPSEKDVTLLKLKSFACTEGSVADTGSEIKVLVIPQPASVNQGGALQSQLSVCVHEKQAQLMTVVTIAVKTNVQHMKPELKAIQIQKGTNIADACLVADGGIRRLIVASKTSQGDDVLHLEAPWSSSFRIDLPQQYLVHEKGGLQHYVNGPKLGNNAGLRRVIEGSQVKLFAFATTFNLSHLSVIDTMGRLHGLVVALRPRQQLERRVLQVCRFILPAPLQDSLLVAYWEITRWLDSQDAQEGHHVALAIMLFVMAVPFISAYQNKPITPGRRKRPTGTRLSSGSLVHNTSMHLMHGTETVRCTPSWTHGAAWSWTDNVGDSSDNIKAASIDPSMAHIDPSYASSQLAWLVCCTDLAREFLQSPAGESMNGPEGYLPTAINQDQALRRTALASVVVALYLLLEELKLEVPRDESLVNDRVILTGLLWQLSVWLGWPAWVASLQTQHTAQTLGLENLVIDKCSIDNLKTPSEPIAPLSIFEYINSLLHFQPHKFHTLAEVIQTIEGLKTNHPLLTESAAILPRSSGVLEGMHRFDMRSKDRPAKSAFPITGLPVVIERICRKSRSNGAASKSVLSPLQVKSSSMKLHIHHITGQGVHTGTRDVRVMCSQALETDSVGRWDVSSEIDRQAATRMIFSQDRRFQEASKLVNQSRPPEVEYERQPNWTEADELEAQKLLAQYATRRTFAVVSGRGLMHFNARTPLLTEMVPRAQFSMQCMVKPKSETQNEHPMTFSADRTLFTEEKVSWAFFHNGASAGLMISKSAEFIDTSWILYNKPSELNNRHAGFLLALGLNGHLKTLAKWVAFKYLTPKHTMTSVGLLLGLAASYRGTCDTIITRLLSVHVTCLLPPGAAELNVSPLTQTTGLVGIGLLYHDSQHRRMSDVMIAEIETQEPEEQPGEELILRDEGYRLAAGIALGLINLGHGQRLHSLQDMRAVERMLAIAVGTKNVNHVHVLDRATAGAVIAVAFMFMKTNDASVARKVDVPDTLHQFEYVRPDIFLLRTLARHLIMWDNLLATEDFVASSLPLQYRHKSSLKNIKRLVTNDLPFFNVVAGICFAIALRFAGSQQHDARDLLLCYLDQFWRLSRLSALNYDAKVTLNGIRNCLDILALSCATVMAGSGDLEVYRRLRALHGRTDKDTPFGSHLAAHMAIGALFLSGGTATFGTSNLAVASLVIAFYPLFPIDVLDNRGHLQALRHFWVLAAEHRCLILRDSEHGQILPNIDATIELEDGSTTVLRTPGLLPELDQVKTIRVSAENFWPLKRILNERPALDSSSQSPRSTSRTYRDMYKASVNSVSITLHHRDLYDKPNIDQFSAELHALDLCKGVPTLDTTTMSIAPTDSSPTIPTPSPVDWIFDLHSFKDLDHSERALTLANHRSSVDGHNDDYSNTESAILATTPIDIRLELELGTLGPEVLKENMQRPLKQDKLWQIRLLLSWADCLENNGDGRGRDDHIGLRDEIIERLRWRVWRMSVGTQTQYETQVEGDELD